MKKRNKLTTLVIGTVLTLSMAGSVFAATTDAANVLNITKQEAAAELKTELTIKYGKISKIDKDKIEIEIADEVKADDKKADDKKTEALTLKLSGKTESIKLEKNTLIQRETSNKDKENADKKTEDKNNSTKDATAENKENTETSYEKVTKDDLKADDIIRVTLDKDNKVTEVTVMANVMLEAAAADKTNNK